MYLGWLLWELNDILLGEFSLFFHSYLYYYWFLKFMLNDGCKRDQKIKTNLLSWRSRDKRTLWSWDGQLQANAFTFASTGLGKVKCGTGAVYLWREVQQNSQMAFLKTWNYPPPPLAWYSPTGVEGGGPK